MYKNYFYLFRCIQELEPLVRGKKIFEIYTQEKDKLFFHIPLRDKPNFHIIISTNSQQHSITIKDEHHKAKKNTINFFVEFLPSSIGEMKIASGERIISLVLSLGKLFIVFRGSKSNVYFLDEQNNLHSFKKTADKERKNIAEELSKTEFIKESVYSSINNIIDEATVKKLPFIGKDIFIEVESRNGEFKKNLFDVLCEIQYGKIAVHFTDGYKPAFHPAAFISIKPSDDYKTFDNYFDALNRYFALYYSGSKVKDIRKEIEKYLTAEIEKLSNKLNNLKARVYTGSKENIYHHYANLLLANIHSIHKGMNSIDIQDYVTGKQVKIQLDEKLSPHQNVSFYYNKARSEKIEFQKSKELLNSTKNRYGTLITARTKFEKIESEEELIQLKKELKMKSQVLPSDEKKENYSFRHYLLENKYHVFVGRNSRNNDLLTTQFARQNDYWFHARSVSGSHVILKVENTKEAIPKKILQQTASIAAFYSKSKTSKLAPVTYTLKKYVVKNKRHELGQVTVTKENVLLVKPEIPEECKPIED
ncbi:MAG: NFACT RNA binding domain-containing protein [Bacteroidota bacterium]